MISLRRRLIGLWLLIALVAAVLAVDLFLLYRHSAQVQIRDAERTIEQACAQIAQAVENGAPPAAALDGLLRRYAGVEGGLWTPQLGFVAYAYPTHVGGAPKQDMPATELPLIERLVQAAHSLGEVQRDARRGTREAFALHACPAGERVVWTMMRISLVAGELLFGVSLGMALLLGFVVAAGLWLAVTLAGWSAKLARLERALASYPLDDGPPLEPTGAQELDRIVSAINALHARLAEARRRSRRLSRELAQSERLAAIGRTAAAVAHEIRNPLATLRLRAENALADPQTRALPALEAVLVQVQRLETLMQNLLTFSQPLRIEPATVVIGPWLDALLDAAREHAAARGVTITAESHGEDSARFDAQWLGRAVENLLRNAIQHAPPGSSVHVALIADGEHLRISVTDQGPGIPEALRATLFEPFASGRPDGTGLGLALVREIARAHGGNVRLGEADAGTELILEIPQQSPT
ncbi:sensor histidine kinase [Sinimarinibacterium thermocellulolyticum]|uniref:histidine kinase n=1 Tax=Sinimarinibacterium thermocellulolyticum TaxID=3170016 RepID=A0ABV2AAJ8_9GAMM